MDTSGIGHNRSLNIATYQALKRLVAAGQITLHIPYVVKREFETQEYERYIKEYETMLSGIKGLNKIEKEQKIQKVISDFQELIKSLDDELKKDAYRYSKLWFEGLNTQFAEIDATQTKEAFEAYFLGSAPLTQPKNRLDIPDSFICREIEKIKENNDHLHFIVQDKKIVKTFENNKDITLYKDIPSFIMSDKIQKILKGLDVVNKKINDMLQFVESLEQNNPTIKEYLSSSIGDSIIGETIQDSSIPDDNHEATITMYNDGTNIELDFKNPIYYGENQIGVKFSLEVEVNADYYIYKADYYSMLDEDSTISVSDWNNHYFQAEDEFNIKVTGIVSVKINTKELDLVEISKLEEEELDDYFHDVYSEAEVNIESIENIDLI